VARSGLTTPVVALAGLVAAVFVAGWPVLALPGDAAAIAAASDLDHDPEDIAAVTAVCSRCHMASQFLGSPRSSVRWEQTYARMSQNGARGSDEQLNRVVRFFQQNLTIINLNSSPAEELGPTLQVSDDVVDRLLARRAKTKFKNAVDVAAVPGIDTATLRRLDAKGLLQF